MDPNYRATDENWQDAGAFASDTKACLLELRARIEALEADSIEQARSNKFCIDAIVSRVEALEAAQQPDQITYEPRWHMLSEEEPQIGDHCIYQFHPSQLHQLDTYPSLLHTYGAWRDESTERIYRKGFWAPHSGLFVGDPRRISWRLAMPHEIPPQPVPDHIADASKMVDTGWQNMADGSPIMEPAPPAPAGELVERVADAIYRNGTGDGFREEARAAIREIAGWLRSQLISRAVADRLEQEAER